jgi:glutaminyl-peptide cyclotransferase
MSDGTSEIRVWDAVTLKEVRRITVRNGKNPIDQINEIEFVDGEIYANVWQTDYILRISPATGQLLGIIDMRGLLDSPQGADVLNGIAYDAVGKRLFVTGKLWPKIYQVEITRVR